MKKTFKGYSALIALLIALLVVTAMPMMAFADEATEAEEETTETFVFSVGGEKHLLNATPTRVFSEPTCGKDGLKEYQCLGSVDKDGNVVGDCGYGGKHIVADTNRPKHTEYAKSQTGSDCTTGGEVEIWCSVCKQYLRTEKLETTDHAFLDADFSFYSLDKDGNRVKGDTYIEYNDDYYVRSVYFNYRYWDTSRTFEQMMKWEAEEIENFNEEYNAEIVYPTCQKEGSVTFICTVCGAKETYKIEKDPDMHTLSDWKDIEGSEATCTKAGAEGRYCVDPGHKDHAPFFSRTKDALGHDYKYVKVTEYKDCIPSKINVICSRCGDSKEITYAQVGTGAYANINKEKIPTKHTFKEIKKHFIEKVPALELESKNWKFDGTTDNAKVVPKNCAEDAVFVFKCEKWNADHDANDINAYKVVERKASAHTYGAWTTVTAATDDKAGFYTRKCSVCGDVQNKTGWLVNGNVVDKDGNETAPVNFELDVTGVKDGAGTAKVSGSDVLPEDLYARVTWVYELSDGSTFAYAAMADVAEDGTIKVGGAMTPRGATLVETQVALTDDADANTKGEFNQLAGAKA